MAEKGDINTGTIKKLSREQLLEVSTRMIEEIEHRVSVDRFRIREGDETKLKFLRVLVSAIQVHSSILKDEQMDSIESRLAALEAGNDKQNI